MLLLALLTNIAFFLSCLSSPSPFFFVSSFVFDAFFLKYYKERTIRSIYSNICRLLNLSKAALFAALTGSFFSFFPFLIIEIYLVPFFRAAYYFKFLASSLPMLNFQNFGQLAAMVKFIRRIGRYRVSGYVRPAAQALMAALVVVPGRSLWIRIYLGVVSLFIIKLLFDSLRYYVYLRSDDYRNDLAKHAEFHDPEVIVYLSGARGSVYQLKQWMPILDKLKQRVTVIAREKFWINDFCDSPLHTVYSRSMTDNESFLTPATKVCLYPANGKKNSQMMRRTELVHIFINHGESDKIVNVSRFVKAYDKLYLAGPMARDRLREAGIALGDDQYTYVGRPQTSIFIRPSTNKTSNILYAPTWEGFDEQANYTSVGEMALGIVNNIISGSDFNIVFKPHPLTGIKRPELKQKLREIEDILKKTGRGEYVTEGDIVPMMNECDLMITDISSVMNDFLETGKPFVVTNPLNEPQISFIEQYKTTKAAYIIANGEEINDILQLIDSSDPKQAERQEVRKYSLGDFDCSSFEKFQLELDKDCNG